MSFFSSFFSSKPSTSSNLNGSSSSFLNSNLRQKTLYFHLPISSVAKDAVFLTGKGSYSTGNVVIKVEDPQDDGNRVQGLDKGNEKNFEVHLDGERGKDYVIVDEKVVESANLGEKVEVEVIIIYTDEALLDQVEVKQLEREGESGTKEVGVGIFTPSRIPFHLFHLYFSITVRFPPSLKTFNYLYIFGPSFTISTDSSSISKLTFSKVYFKTTNGSFNISKLTALDAILDTVHGTVKIAGNEISKDLNVLIQNGDINLQSSKIKRNLIISGKNGSLRASNIEVSEGAKIELDNGRVDFSGEGIEARWIRIDGRNGSINGKYGIKERLELETTNSSIHAQVALLEVKQSAEPAKVTARSVNGSVNLSYIQHAYDRDLISNAITTNGSVDVHHQPAFEGNFKLSTVWGNGSTPRIGNPSDPSGRGRTKKLQIKKDESGVGHRLIEGSTWWQKKDSDTEFSGLGYSEAKSSSGSVKIQF